MGRWPGSFSSPVAGSVFIHRTVIFEGYASLKWMPQQSHLKSGTCVTRKKKLSGFMLHEPIRKGQSGGSEALKGHLVLAIGAGNCSSLPTPESERAKARPVPEHRRYGSMKRMTLSGARQMPQLGAYALTQHSFSHISVLLRPGRDRVRTPAAQCPQ